MRDSGIHPPRTVLGTLPQMPDGMGRQRVEGAGPGLRRHPPGHPCRVVADALGPSYGRGVAAGHHPSVGAP